MLDSTQIKETLTNIQYKDWNFHLGTMDDGFFVQVCFLAVDNDNPAGPEEIQKGRKWYLSRFMTIGEVVQTVFAAILMAEEHETRELFTYKGVRVFGPHMNLDTLVSFVASGNTLHRDPN